MPKPFEHSVFINIPYDKSYENIFVAMVASLVSIGKIPRCTLEIAESGEGRLNRIYELLEECAVSIHDLSHVRTPVRFNMPFELGIACSLKRYKGSHSYILFEKVGYRLDRTLSDIKGRDPYIYKGSMLGIVNCVLDALGSETCRHKPSRVHKFAQDLLRIAKDTKKERKIESIFKRAVFHELINVALTLAVDRGFIPENK